MGLNVKTSKNAPGAKIEPMEPGLYPVRLVMVVDCGLQAQRPFKGQEKDPKYEIGLTYEFVDEFMKDEDGQPQPDKPRWLTEFFPAYSLEVENAKSTKRYLAFDPNMEADGDWSRLLGAPASVHVTHNENKKTGRTYENVDEVVRYRLKEAERVPELVNKPVVFDLDEPDLEAFKALPRFFQKKIKDNLEFKGSKLAELLEENADPTPAKNEGAVGEDDENPY